ncbi:MAG: prolyl oligopeptidase family serine peptidase, partial [Bacteroidetes bacterium]|nr:prolyl oligopeptidase family serine peptidase [Bacteroidota bacterium]
QDSRVHPNQSKAIYKTLKQKGLETELVFYHNEGHGFTMYSHKIDLINRVLEWFYKQLKEKIN